MSDHEYHLLDPSEYQLHIDPSLGAGLGGIPSPDGHATGLGYGMGTGMVDDFYHSSLFPSPGSLLGPGGGPPGASFDLFQHYTEPPGPAAGGLSLPPLPFGLQADGNGVGGTVGDWSMRFMPYIPGLNEPDPPDIEEIKRQHGPTE